MQWEKKKSTQFLRISVVHSDDTKSGIQPHDACRRLLSGRNYQNVMYFFHDLTGTDSVLNVHGQLENAYWTMKSNDQYVMMKAHIQHIYFHVLMQTALTDAASSWVLVLIIRACSHLNPSNEWSTTCCDLLQGKNKEGIKKYTILPSHH